jgi:hypothetical protein
MKILKIKEVIKMYGLEEYDREKLREARKLVLQVFEYYYGDYGSYRLSNRLATILGKIDDLLKMDTEAE